MPGRGSFRTTSHVLGLITLVGRLTQEQVSGALGALDLTFAQAVALVRLWRIPEGAMPQSELIESLAVSRAFGSQLLADLERRGLVERHPDDSDGRRQVVQLTEAGRSLEGPVFEVFDLAEEELLDGVDPDRRRLCHDLLQTMLGNAETRRSAKP